MRKGFTLIELMIVIAIIAIIAAIAIPNLLRARAAANEASAISSLRTLVSSQAMFFQGDIETDGTNDYASSLEELSNNGMIDNVLGTGTKSGYVFTLTTTNAVAIWNCVANPLVAESTGNRYFFVNEAGVIRFNTTEEADSDDPAIE